MFRTAVLMLSLSMLFAPQPVSAQESLSTRLMRCTFRISAGVGKSNGTAFVLTRDDAQEQRILVTAAHALVENDADQANLICRKQTGEGAYEKLNVPLPIRQNGKPLWTQHPTEDVAVLAINLPPEADVSRVPVNLLATDELLKKYEVAPGDILRCIGFPHAGLFEANAAGFPVVRIGCLSSFPVLPTRTTKTFHFDYNAFEGDSGGAVYLDESGRSYGGQTQAGRTQLIVGMVIRQQMIDENFKLIYQSGQTRHRMGLGIIAHASAIRETIDLLGEKKPAE